MTIMTNKNGRALRTIVWLSRSIGWILVAIAIVNSLQIVVAGLSGSLRLISSVALGVLGVAWIVGLELFLRFFDKFLSRN